MDLLRKLLGEDFVGGLKTADLTICDTLLELERLLRLLLRLVVDDFLQNLPYVALPP